jgi:hypothetical protein
VSFIFIPGEGGASSGVVIKNAAGATLTAADTLQGNAATAGLVTGFAQTDASGDLEANVINQTGTQAALLALAGNAGRFAYATDTKAIVAFSGVALGAVAFPALTYPLALNQGGTGDGVNFSWTAATRKLVARVIASDGGNTLALQTPNGVGAGSSGNLGISSGSVTTGNAGQFIMSGGNSTTGTAGAFSAQAGASTTGAAGSVTLSAGSASGAGSGGSVTVEAGNNVGGGPANAGTVTLIAGIDSNTNTTSTAATSGSAFSFQDGQANTYIQMETAVAGNPGVGLYSATPVAQATTAGAAAAFVAGAGTPVTSASTFDGYTLAQIVKALRNIGVLA